MNFTIYQVIAFLSQIENKDRKFRRINDNNFIIFRGSYGDIMLQVKEFIRPLPIFLYMQDKWELVE